jgi:hypothetical protein
MLPNPEVVWVPYEKMEPDPEHRISPVVQQPLYESVCRNGYQRPLRAWHDVRNDRWLLRDGEHRWRLMVDNEDIQNMTGGLLPVVRGPKEVKRMGVAEQQQDQTPADEVEVRVSPGGGSRSLVELLQELGVTLGVRGIGSGEEFGSQVANMQAQIDSLRADTQRMVDELRAEVKGS